MSLSDIIHKLEDQLEDLQRNTKFCLNSYDYHHENNEYEILQSLQEILNEAFEDGREYQKTVDNVSESLKKANEMCLQVDQKLNMLGIEQVEYEEPIDGGSKGNYPSTGHTVVFKDDQQSDESIDADHGDNNKENTY